MKNLNLGGRKVERDKPSKLAMTSTSGNLGNLAGAMGEGGSC